jgi:hypothetical protein
MMREEESGELTSGKRKNEKPWIFQAKRRCDSSQKKGEETHFGEFSAR